MWLMTSFGGSMRAAGWCLRILLIATLASTGIAHAETASDDGRLARLSWSAYKCVDFAARASKHDAQTRLFSIATDAGRRFIEGVKSGAITKESVDNQAPIGFLLRMEGPSADFMLGRVYSAASNEAENELMDACGQCRIGSELLKVIAANLYHQANCELLGR